MATDFFERQSQARRNTSQLVVLFGLAVVGIVGLVMTAVHFGMDNYRVNDRYPWEILLASGGATLVVIVGGSWYKTSELRHGGGTGVAESLGGKRVFPNEGGLTERRLLNVVEEMALASGTPVPPVYLLEEQGINAFAAGYSPSDAVLGITRGCAESLTREELQGVVAHEFSHVLNGDMRMSIRLIGILHGILVLGLIGQGLLRVLFYMGEGSRRRSSSDDGKSVAAIIVVLLSVSATLCVIGYIGTFFGGLIKAAVSRQREYLADASAVQFTRQPSGIAGALKKIGGAVRGSRLKHMKAAEMSHMYFSQGVWEGFTGLMATHPPLQKRIKAVEPGWDGVFPEFTLPQLSSQSAGNAQIASIAQVMREPDARPSAETLGVERETIPLAVVDDAANQIGEPEEHHRQHAASLLNSLDPMLLKLVREPYSARAVVFGLLLDRDIDVRAKQFAVLDRLMEADIADATRRMMPALVNLDVRARLPLVDLALPALRAMSPQQHHKFGEAFSALIAADSQLGLFEWTLSQVLLRHLQPQFGKVPKAPLQFYGLQRLGEPISVLLSTLAYAGHAESQAAKAFGEAAGLLPDVTLHRLPQKDCNLRALDGALKQLAKVASKHRGRLIDACAASVCADGRVTLREGELLRGISDLLDCPMPPLVAGQKVASQTVAGKPNGAT